MATACQAWLSSEEREDTPLGEVLGEDRRTKEVAEQLRKDLATTRNVTQSLNKPQKGTDCMPISFVLAAVFIHTGTLSPDEIDECVNFSCQQLAPSARSLVNNQALLAYDEVFCFFRGLLGEDCVSVARMQGQMKQLFQSCGNNPVIDALQEAHDEERNACVGESSHFLRQTQSVPSSLPLTRLLHFFSDHCSRTHLPTFGTIGW